MSTYDKASLVLIPSGTKTSKIYSQKPINGDGDFSFSRSTMATRVNESGLIEKETQNLLLQSNNFNTSWGENFGISPRTSGHTGYDGTNDAWLLEKDAYTYAYMFQDLNASGLQTYSVYAKANTLSQATIYINGNANNYYGKFNLSNGSVVATANIITSNVVDVGSGWYRLSITINDTTSRVRIYPDFAETSAGSIYIQDAQLEQGLVARDYIETTTSAVYGGITDNVPRIDYTDASCPSLLLEPTRTNRISNSEFINNDSSWAEENGADCTPNYAISPEGVKNATRVQLDNSGANLLTRIWHNFTPDSSNDTASFYAKSNTGSSFDITFYLRDSGFGTVRATKTVTLTNEWQRFELTADCSGASGNVMLLLYNTTASENWDFLLYAPQVEAGSYATSYIPCYGTSVTRNTERPNYLDVTNLTGSSFTIFLDYKDAIRDGNTGNWMYLYNTSNQLLTYVYGTTLMLHSTSGEDYTSFTFGDGKVAFVYDGTNVKYFLNGTLVKTVTASTRWDLGAEKYWLYNPFNNSTSTIKYNSFIILPEAITDQEAINLTTT